MNVAGDMQLFNARSGKLRSEHQYCRFISAFVKTSLFALNEPYYGKSTSVKLLAPTQDSRDIIAAAMRCLDAAQKKATGIKNQE